MELQKKADEISIPHVLDMIENSDLISILFLFSVDTISAMHVQILRAQGVRPE